MNLGKGTLAGEIKRMLMYRKSQIPSNRGTESHACVPKRHKACGSACMSKCLLPFLGDTTACRHGSSRDSRVAEQGRFTKGPWSRHGSFCFKKFTTICKEYTKKKGGAGDRGVADKKNQTGNSVFPKGDCLVGRASQGKRPGG